MGDGREIKDTWTHLSCFSQQDSYSRKTGFKEKCSFFLSLEKLEQCQTKSQRRGELKDAWQSLFGVKQKAAAAERVCPDHRPQIGKLAPKQGLDENYGLLVNVYQGEHKRTTI